MTLTDFRILTLFLSVGALLTVCALFLWAAIRDPRPWPMTRADQWLTRAMMAFCLLGILSSLSGFPPAGIWRDAYRTVDNLYSIFWCVWMCRRFFRAREKANG